MKTETKNSDSGIKIPQPMEPFFSFIEGMNWMRPSTNFMNFHVEGSFVTFYMPLEAKFYYESLLIQEGYKCEMTRIWAVERGYPVTDFYFRVGPYQMRLSILSGYRERQKRIIEGGII